MQDFIFETERLYVKQYVPADEHHFFRLNSDREVMQYIRLITDENESRHFLLENIAQYQKSPMTGRWAVRAKDEDRFVGTFALIPMEHSHHWQVGYALMKEEWGKGFATELVQTGTAYAFRRMMLSRLMAVTEISNVGSKNVLGKTGFRQLENIQQDGKELCLFELINPGVIETRRLLIAALDQEQVHLYARAGNVLENQLGLREGDRQVSPALREMMNDITLPAMRKAGEHDYFFHTIWIIIDKTENKLVGEIGFKGLPDSRGTVEVGYATFPSFQKSGYMTEALDGVCKWCEAFAGIKIIAAETEVENEASQKVLTRNQFELAIKRQGMLVWQRKTKSVIP